jgi:hypothetical protein
MNFSVWKLFGRKKDVMEKWTDPWLRDLRVELERLDLAIAEHERAWDALDARSDYRAAEERDALQPRLRQADARRSVLLLQIAAAEERERIIDALIQQHMRETALLTETVETIKARTSVPAAQEIADLYVRTRRLEDLRRVLHDATDERRFAKSQDFVDAVRYHWHEQAVSRERLLFRVLSPGHRPKSEPPSWAAQMARLRELHEVKEETHAAVR